MLAEETDGIREAWATWLGGYTWDHFITVTFRELCPAHRSDAVLNSIMRTVITLLDPYLVFLGTERHLNQFIHVHGLIQTRPHANLKRERTALYHKLFDVFGRSQVVAPRGNTGVTRYVSKYCVKGLEGYMIGGRKWK